MTTYFNNYNNWSKPVVPKPSIEDMQTVERGLHITELLYDLLTIISPHGKEDAVAEVIVNFVKEQNPKADIKFDAKNNLHIKVGKKPRVMFSCHTDTVQKNIEQHKETTLHLSSDSFVYASVPQKTEFYVDEEGERVSQHEIQAHARKLGHSFSHYTLFPNNGIKNQRTLFGSRTMFDGWTPTDMKFTVEEEVVPTPCVLGADDKLGCYIMCHLIQANVEGLYVFHVGEEVGAVGSSYLSAHRKELFTNIDYCVAFDRMNYGDVITHQSSGRCCSDEFANALSAKINEYLPPMQQMAPSTLGSFTDSANYTDLISECTNVSVGYFSQHSANENFDLEWLEVHLLPALLKVDWSDLPVVRDAVKPDAPRFHRHGKQTGKGYASSYSRTNNSHKGSRSLVPARKSQANKTQSLTDKFWHIIDEMEDFDPEVGFSVEESSRQRQARVLATIIKDGLSLEEIAQLIVLTHEHAKDRNELWRNDSYWEL
jgi:hypothetical protein